jgi:hypothetical protein
MQLYSEEKDWAKLVEVVLKRLADFVEDPKQRAKYMHTAAIVSCAADRTSSIKALGVLRPRLEFDPDARQGRSTRRSSYRRRRGTTPASNAS